MTTGWIADETCLRHNAGAQHPESPNRFRAAVKAVEPMADKLTSVKIGSCTHADLARVHDGKYLATAEREIKAGSKVLSTGDTNVSEGSLAAANVAAASVLGMVDAVFTKQVDNGFCIVRPPGHHATPNRGMGFCVYNTVAVAARYAQAKYDAERVFIFDWDVHHGNGTQDCFYRDESVFFASTHQSPWYPFTGKADETGDGKGKGTIANYPLPAGTDGKRLIGALREHLLPAVARFKPDLVIISAGFDSRLGDPLGQFRLTDEDFRELTKLMMDVASTHADQRLVSVMEGGYNLTGLAAAVAAHVDTLHKG
jgi:acetoin utilization deacetylase AcuC-like enzyme